MDVLFRTDANPQIGAGHLMRCLALAEALRVNGARCTFLSRAVGLGSLAERIVSAGHALLALPEVADEAIPDADAPPHAAWLPGGWRADVASCLDLLAGRAAADWLVVDHYALDSRWEKAMQGAARHRMVIDDLADRPHDCDLLLDQNRIDVAVTPYDRLVPKRCTRLLGPRFALLRAEFQNGNSPSSLPAMESQPVRLLVMFGGSDPQSLTVRTLGALARAGWQGPVDVVVGPLNPNLQSVRDLAASLRAARVHAPLEDVARLMREADLAIGSPGVSSWERCACRLPSLAIAQALNQESLGEALAIAGAHWYLGSAEALSDLELETALKLWLSNAAARRAMATAAGRICDGKGARRVAAHLSVPALSLRLVRPEDGGLLFMWRNDERIRNASFDSRPLQSESHRTWLDKVLNDNNVILLLACRDAVPVASIRFDCAETRARISIYVDPELHGQGLGQPALLAALDWLRSARRGIKTVEADVIAGNNHSQAMFAAAGFHPAWMRYELSCDQDGERDNANEVSP